MTRLARNFAAGLFLLSFAGGCGESAPESSAQVPEIGAETPDLSAERIFLGDHILTMDGSTVSAVAISGGRILWVGSREDAGRWQDTDTVMTDLGDRALLPGFIDAHGHLAFTAQTINFANVASPPVGPVDSMATLQDVLREFLADGAFEPGDWVIGMGYDDSLLEEQRHPDRDDLDRVTQDHPLALIHVSGHLATANSLALELMGINADTPDPAGGLIRRRAGSQEPNGVLEEAAARPVQGYAFAPSKNPAADLAKALHIYASFGVTTVQDGASSLPIYQMFEKMAAEHPFELDVVVYPMAQGEGFEFPADTDTRSYNNGLKLGGIKLSLDGSPQGKTAYMTEPYLIPPEGKSADYRGYPSMEQEKVDALVAKYLEQGVQILAHANGDAAADMLLDAISRAGEAEPLGDHRTVMIHAQTVREDQLDEMNELAVIPSYFSAHSYFWGDWHRDSVFGEARASRISPTQSTIARGMPFTIHNDTPIVPSDMIRLIWATVNRLTRSGQVLGEAQRISALDAIRATTADAAYQYFEEDSKGVLAPGMQADLVILSSDPTQVAPEEIIDIEVLETIARGKSVYVK